MRTVAAIFILLVFTGAVGVSASVQDDIASARQAIAEKRFADARDSGREHQIYNLLLSIRP